jgi:alanyl-tRNA synthetase
MPVADLVANPENAAWQELSVEFCGGTHLTSTREAGQFAVVAEEAVAKGVRRVVALTGVPAMAAIRAAENMAARVREASRLEGGALQTEVNEVARELEGMTVPVAQKDELRRGIAALQERLKAGQKEAAAAKRSQAAALARNIAESAATSHEEVIVTSLELGSDRGAIEQAVKTIRDKCPRAAVMLLSPDEGEGKVAVVASVPDVLVKRGLNAGEWLREAVAVLGGKGGGRPDMAQGAGPEVGKVREAIAAARTAATRKLK